MRRLAEKIALVALGLLLVVGNGPLAVSALEIEVSDNGAGGSNEVKVQVENETEVTQTNEASVANDVATEAETGDNSVEGNVGGDASIETGDIEENVIVETSLNSSQVDAGTCCAQEVNAQITGNGEGSGNGIDLRVENETKVTVNQTAQITNNVEGSANTGGNSANDNVGGSVTIATGDIHVEGGIINGPVNTASVMVTSGGVSFSAKIDGNGAGSENEIKTKFEDEAETFLNFTSFIDNFVNWDLNTGENEANGNVGGDITITTGDIDFSFLIKNLANLGKVEITSCCELPAPNPPGDGGTPETPYDPGGGNGDDGGGGGDSGGDGGSIASGVSTGIVGLSDTSSDLAQALFFWAGVAMIMGGLGLIAKDSSGKISA